MTCPDCGNAHSFVRFGSQGDVDLVYSAPARARETKETALTFQKHTAHLDQMKGRRWVWVIDFAKMETRHYSSMNLTHKLIKLITEEHLGGLHAIFLVNPNFWLRTTMSAVKPILSKQFYAKLRLFEGTDTGLLLELENAGIQRNWVLWLANMFKSPYSAPVSQTVKI